MLLAVWISGIIYNCFWMTGGGHAQESRDGVCVTPGCVLAAARIINSMDRDVNPCDDFFKFACGTWIKKHVIAEHKSSFSVFDDVRDDVLVTIKAILEESNKVTDSEVVQKARNYYKACMNKDIIEALELRYIHRYMEEFGGWPVLGSNGGGNWDPTRYNLEDLIVQLRRAGTKPLLSVGVITDLKHPTKHILYIDQPGLGIPSRDYYLKDRNDKTLMAYQTMLEDSYVAFGADPTTAADAAKDVVDMEVELANLTAPKDERRDLTKWYNKMTIGELNDKFTGIDWSKILTETMDLVGLSLNESEPVLAASPTFLQKVGNVINKYPSRVIANYAIGRLLLGDKKIFYLPKIFTDIKLRYKQVLSGVAQRSPRWQQCSMNVKHAFSEVVGRLLVEDTFRKGSKDNVLALVENLKTAFKGMVDDLTWMEDGTKQVAREKADVMEPLIGYPELIFNNSALHTKYENVVVYIDDPLRTYISVQEASSIRGLQKLRKDVDKTDWGWATAEVNAYNSLLNNQILFPAAILQPPYYSYEQPAYLNYGGIGYVIGHEITHGFDDQGRRFGKYGEMIDWWSDGDEEEYKRRAQCINDQYGNFVVPGTVGMKINGKLTLGENIADNGGLKESFKAYRNWVETTRHGREEDKLPGLDFTPDQLYFLSFAQTECGDTRNEEKVKRIRTDPHSPVMFRVLGPLQNSEEFSYAWNCSTGSFMNPLNKCSVW